MMDADGDGIYDDLDKCPGQKGIAKYQGCPIPDSDGDGINDEVDRCPNEAGTKQGDGCPETAQSVPPGSDAGEPVGSGVSPPPPPESAGPGPAGAKKKLPQASITYSFKDKVPKGSSILIYVVVQLDRPMVVVEEALRQIINQKRSTEVSNTDTSIIRSRTVTGDKLFHVTLECDGTFFKVDSLATGIQELNTSGNTVWKWRVYGLKEINKSELTLTIRAKGKQENWYDVDNGVLPLSVTVESTGGSAAMANESAARQQTAGKAANYLVPASIALLVVGVLLFFFYKRKARSKNSIYFSYAWNGEHDTLVGKMYDSLKKDGFNVKRDKTDLNYKGKISAFMSDIGKADLILVFISDKYLRSKYCMFELYEIFKNSKMNKDEFIARIFPLRMEDIRLDKPGVINEYINYWEAEQAHYVKLIQENSDNVTAEQSNEYQVLKRIITDLGTLLQCLADINALSLDALVKNDFFEIKQALRKALEQRS